MGFALVWIAGIIVAGLAFGWTVAFWMWLIPIVLAGLIWIAHVVIVVFDL